MNKSDSERIGSVFEKMGYKLAPKENGADLIVINMCSVRQSAVDRVYGLSPKFMSLKKENPVLKTILTGCVLKKDFKTFKDFFDFILPIKTLEYWPEILKRENYSLHFNQRNPEFNEKFAANYFKILPKHSQGFSAFMPISAGCNNSCAYCVVPYTRGPLICRPHQDILNNTKDSIEKGAKEVWFLGQNVNDYKSPADASIDFPKLLKMANDIPKNFWIRFTSPNPKDFCQELISVMAESKKITEHLNLPLQSGDNEILKNMNRPYTAEQYKGLVEKIRQKMPDVALSTDVIVGFPGETKEQFQNTVKLFKEIKFDMAYIAQYSPRPGTQAAEMENDVSRVEKEKRWKTLTQILEKTALEKNKEYIGKEVQVLVNEQKDGFLYGKTRTYKTVKFSSFAKASSGKQNTRYKIQDTNLAGQFVNVKITDALPWGLKGT